MTTPGDATNVASYKWETLETAVATEGTEVGNTASLVVTDSMKGKYIKLTVTDDAGVAYTAISSTAVTEDNSGDVKIINTDAFQSDGTAVVGDDLQVSYGSSFGVPKSITWYLNDVVAKASNSNQGGIDLYYAPAKAGTVYAVIAAEDGKTYTSSNTVVVVEDQLAPTISGFEIVNDYEGKHLTAAKADTHAIAKLTVSKMYAGQYYIFKKGVDYTKTNKFDNAFFGPAHEVTKASFTTKTLEGGGYDENYNVIVPENGIYYQEDNGTTHIMWDIDADPIRGTEYVIAFDQDKLSTDDIGSSVNANINMAAESAVAPYLTAPSAIELKTPTAGVGTYEITFKNGDAQYEGLTETTASSFATTVVYTKKDSAASTASSVGTVNTAFEDGKVKQESLTNAVKTQIYYVESNLKAGIFGASAEKITSAEVTCGTPGSGAVSLKKNSTTPTSADITFKTKTLDDGVVYVTKDLTKFKATDSGSYTSSVEVKKDATTATVVDAFDEGGIYYYAVFVPNTTDTYSNVESVGYEFKSGTVAKIDFATVTGVTGASKGVELSSKLVATDAFGVGVEPTTKAYADADMLLVDETKAPINATKCDATIGNYDADANFAVDGDTGAVTFTVEGAAKKGETYAALLDVGAIYATCTTAGSAETSVWDIVYTADPLTVYNVQADGTNNTASTTAIAKLKDGWNVNGIVAGTLPTEIASGATFNVGAGVAFAANAAGTTNKGTINADINGGSFTTAAITNEGTINIQTGTTTFSGGLKNAADGTVNIAGTMTVDTAALENLGTINNKGVLDIDFASASSGTIAGKNGTINLNAAAGVLTVSDGTNELGTVIGGNANSELKISGGANTITDLGNGAVTKATISDGTNTITVLDISTGVMAVTGGTTTITTWTSLAATSSIGTGGTVKCGTAGLNGKTVVLNGGTLDVSAAVSASAGTLTASAASTLIVPAATDVTSTTDGDITYTCTKGNAFVLTVKDSTGTTIGTVDTTAGTNNGTVANDYTAATTTVPASTVWSLTDAS